MKATLSYLNCVIEVTLPDNPNEDNTVFVSISMAEGTYDPNLYTGYINDWQFSAESEDPNQWIFEALTSAIKCIGKRFSPYAEFPNSTPGVFDLDFIPF